jgi:hypothetical protein
MVSPLISFIALSMEESQSSLWLPLNRLGELATQTILASGNVSAAPLCIIVQRTNDRLIGKMWLSSIGQG